MLGRLSYKFFKQHPKDVSPLLLGKYIVRELEEGKVIVKIVETEAYGGFEDDACHVGRFGRTKRTETLFGGVGKAYIYSVHINTYCLNIVCHKENEAGGILIRAAVPVEGLQIILKNLNKTNLKNVYSDLRQYHKFLNGPGKLCRALRIDKTLNSIDMIKSEELYLLEGEKIKESEIIKTPRINIPYAKKSKNWFWRFVIKDFA